MGEKMETAIASACAKATVKSMKAAKKICARKLTRTLFCLAVAVSTMTVFSVIAFAEGEDGTAVANAMIEQIKTWVGVISGVVIVFGAVNAGLGVANQDDAGRNKGFMTMAGGAIMAAVVGLVGGSGGTTTTN